MILVYTYVQNLSKKGYQIITNDFSVQIRIVQTVNYTLFNNWYIYYKKQMECLVAFYFIKYISVVNLAFLFSTLIQIIHIWIIC